MMKKNSLLKSMILSISTLMSVCILTGCSSGSGEDSKKEEIVITDPPVDVDQEISEFISTPRFRRYDIDEKLSRTAEYLNELAEDGRIQSDSVVIHENLQYVEYKENTGGTTIVDFRPHEEGTGSWNVNEMIQDIPIVRTRNTAANIVMMSGFFETAKENLEYYQDLSDFFNASDLINGEIKVATLNNMRNGLMNKDMVIIACHGNLFEYYDETATFLTAFDDTVDQACVNDYNEGRTVKLIEQSGAVHYAMTPDFFSYYYGNGKLKDTIIHMSSCFCFGESLDDNYVLTDVFLDDCGAEVVIGHDNSVYIAYDYAILLAEMQILEQGGTVREALDYAISLYGDNDKDYLKVNTTYFQSH